MVLHFQVCHLITEFFFLWLAFLVIHLSMVVLLVIIFLLVISSLVLSPIAPAIVLLIIIFGNYVGLFRDVEQQSRILLGQGTHALDNLGGLSLEGCNLHMGII
jgi:ABC-type transport system involved in cytochrome bd biosynthesis fused ATPase/permease subunit